MTKDSRIIETHITIKATLADDYEHEAYECMVKGLVQTTKTVMEGHNPSNKIEIRNIDLPFFEKRGRPRKAEKMPVEQPVKRGRGRPRKV